MDIKDYLGVMVEKNASDLFLRVGGPAHYRIAGKVITHEMHIISKEEMKRSVRELTNDEQRKKLEKEFDIDLAVNLFIKGFSRRFRVSIFLQRGSYSMVIRLIRNRVASFKELNLPEDVLTRLSLETRGLVLLTGAAGSGKSTTLACMIEYINENCKKHILTVEEPIEFIFRDKLSIINQRELGIDVSNYQTALRAFTLQSPDVIFIGNIRDMHTMFAAINAAETGVLVLSTLHTINAAQTIERILNFFPPHQHNEMRTQLSLLLKGIISLRLIPVKEELDRVPACEIMLNTPTISRLIREGRTWEIPSYIEDGAVFGMQTFHQALVKLVRDGKVQEETAAEFADNADEFRLMLRGIKKG